MAAHLLHEIGELVFETCEPLRETQRLKLNTFQEAGLEHGIENGRTHGHGQRLPPKVEP